MWCGVVWCGVCVCVPVSVYVYVSVSVSVCISLCVSLCVSLSLCVSVCALSRLCACLSGCWSQCIGCICRSGKLLTGRMSKCLNSFHIWQQTHAEKRAHHFWVLEATATLRLPTEAGGLREQLQRGCAFSAIRRRTLRAVDIWVGVVCSSVCMWYKPLFEHRQVCIARSWHVS